MKKIIAILFILAFALPGFAKKHQAEEVITPIEKLEKRNFQTRNYQNTDKLIVMKSILNAFQDEGYLIYNVNSLLGFVYAVKDFDTTDPNIDISEEFKHSQARMSYNGVKVATIESASNITEYGNTVRTRINFKRKLLNQYGNAQFIDDIEEPEFYDKFYAKVDREIDLLKKQNKIQKEEKEVKTIIKAPIAKKEIIEKNVDDKEKELTQQIQQTKTEKTIEQPTENVEPTEQKVEISEPIENSEIEQDTKKIIKEAKQAAKQQAKEEKEFAKLQAKEEKERAKEEKELAKLQAKEEKERAKEEAKIIKELSKIHD